MCEVLVISDCMPLFTLTCGTLFSPPPEACARSFVNVMHQEPVLSGISALMTSCPNALPTPAHQGFLTADE